MTDLEEGIKMLQRMADAGLDAPACAWASAVLNELNRLKIELNGMRIFWEGCAEKNEKLEAKMATINMWESFWRGEEPDEQSMDR